MVHYCVECTSAIVINQLLKCPMSSENCSVDLKLKMHSYRHRPHHHCHLNHDLDQGNPWKVQTNHVLDIVPQMGVSSYFLYVNKWPN